MQRSLCVHCFAWIKHFNEKISNKSRFLRVEYKNYQREKAKLCKIFLRRKNFPSFHLPEAAKRKFGVSTTTIPKLKVWNTRLLIETCLAVVGPFKKQHFRWKHKCVLLTQSSYNDLLRRIFIHFFYQFFDKAFGCPVMKIRSQFQTSAKGGILLFF